MTWRQTALSWRRFAANYLHSLAIAMMRREYAEFAPRSWSNRELRRFAHLFLGDVIHVSGWEDRDKEGGFYHDYFSKASSYHLSNFGGARGTSPLTDVAIDLEEQLPSELVGKYDVVFNHTTLEHVFDFRGAFARLCELSKDVVIVVVPFAQVEHWEQGSFLDYWRVTEFGLERLFTENELVPLYIASNHNPIYPTYFFAIGSRHGHKWIPIAQEGRRRQDQFNRDRKFRPLWNRCKVLM
ncbi:MAG TPA: hypothetical protein VFV13_05660 [Acidimicrobiia bacterium]|nr:hypothetical protein [Acidimicrobiia bacterium]